jgi:glutathione S-transferase
MALTFYTNPMSRGRMVRWMLEEVGARYDTIVLDYAYPAAGLMPEDHASLYRWMFFGAGPVEQAVVNTSFGWIAPPEMERRTGYGSLDRVMTTLTGHLTGRRYLVGDSFSAADVYLGSQIGWGLRFGTMPANPVLQAYWDGIATRPAALRANALDDALMRKD